MSIDLDAYRRFFAEDIQICGNLRSAALVDALATVPRERFLPPGPWLIRGEIDFQAPPRRTPGDDPRFIYHNIAVGIDPARMLFNGAPSLVCGSIDTLDLQAGQRALHVGGGTGYYSALIAAVVGPSGSITVVETDEGLAHQATVNLADKPWATVIHGDGRGVAGPFNAIMINAGVTHPEPDWLAALAPGGRMVMPLTAGFAAPGPGPGPKAPGAPAAGAAAAIFGSAVANISKGLMVLVSRNGDTDSFAARLVTFVAIYSAVGLRDDAVNAELGRALGRMPLPALRRFRTDAHEADATCWCHTARGCWSTAE